MRGVTFVALVLVAGLRCSPSAPRREWSAPTTLLLEDPVTRLSITVIGGTKNTGFAAHDCRTKRRFRIADIRVYDSEGRTICGAEASASVWHYPLDGRCPPLAAGEVYGVFVQAAGGRGASRLRATTGEWVELDNVCK